MNAIRFSIMVSVLVTVIVTSRPVQAQPAHNNCSSAITVTEGVTYNGTTTGATGSDLSSCAYNDWRDVWHTWTAPCDMDYRISLCDSSFDTTLAVYTGSCGNLTEIACNDDSSCDGSFTLHSQVVISAANGTTYYIRVAGYDGATGAYALNINPVNDDCADAISVTDGTYSFCNKGATTDGPNEPTLCSAYGDAQVGSDIWYCYDATCTGDATVSLCGSGYDTKLAIYDGCDECPSSSSAIACNDDACNGTLQSEVTFPAAVGSRYLIRIGGYQGAQGSGTMTTTCEGDQPHDDCANAIPVTTGVPYSGATTNATGTDVSSCAYNDWKDVWHTWTAPYTGNATVSLCGSSFDTTLAVYTGSCANLAEIACDDDGCGDTYQSELILNATGGTTYYIRVSGYNAASGNYILTATADLANDECDGALPVTTGVPYSGATTNATGTDVSSCAYNDWKDVWHTWTAPCTGENFRVSLCGSSFDTTLAVYMAHPNKFATQHRKNNPRMSCGSFDIRSSLRLASDLSSALVLAWCPLSS